MRESKPKVFLIKLWKPSLFPIGGEKIGSETAKSLPECKASAVFCEALSAAECFEKLGRYRLIVISIADK